MDARKTKCSAALKYPFLCRGGRYSTADHNGRRFCRITWWQRKGCDEAQ